VTAIDRQGGRVCIENADPIAYDHLLIATGSRPRPLAIAGLEGAITLRTLDDAASIAGNVPNWKSVAIIGGGFIGLELASFLRAQHLDVTVIEAASQLMGRVVSPVTARYFHDLHTRRGTKVLLGRTVVSGGPSGQGWTLELSDGTAIHADAVFSAVGALPNAEIALDCGLAVDRGILVDDMMRTSDPSISAIGDCAVHPDYLTGQRIRLESVQNAVDQGKTFAARLTGQPSPYVAIPWFWSTQGSAKLQIAGLALGPTEDITRSAEDDRLSVFRFAGDGLVAVETVNQPGDHLLARKLLANRTSVSREAVADPTFNLRSLL